MREKTAVLSAFFLSGTLAFNIATAWSQATPGERQPSPSRPEGLQQKAPGAAGQQQQQQWSSEDIKKVQQALKDKGHDPGAVDGVMSSSTQQALRTFQQKNGLQATGSLNAETAAALGVSASGAGGKSSPGPSGTGGKSAPGDKSSPGAGGGLSPGPGSGSSGPGSSSK